MPRTIAAVAACIGFVASCKSPSGLPEPQYEETKQLVATVDQAAHLVEQEGEQAFPKFRRKGSEWFHGDSYIFVTDLKGTSRCSPSRPELEGQNILDYRDADGKQVVAIEIAKVSGNKTSGWIHYRWPRPGAEEESWKTAYVKLVTAASGTEYVVGSGLYDMKVEKIFLVETVDEAAELIEQKGREAFPALRDKAGPFRYRDVYVFVHDKSGTELVNPGFPDMEGQNHIDLEDADGKLIVRETISMLEDKETGWIDYMWPKPGETEPSAKTAYIRKVTVGPDVFYVGAGLYSDS